jgi:hypothetical protein
MILLSFGHPPFGEPITVQEMSGGRTNGSLTLFVFSFNQYPKFSRVNHVLLSELVFADLSQLFLGVNSQIDERLHVIGAFNTCLLVGHGLRVVKFGVSVLIAGESHSTAGLIIVWP